MLDLEVKKVAIASQKARTAALYALDTLLWLLVIAAVCVLPAVVIAGWRWFL